MMISCLVLVLIVIVSSSGYRLIIISLLLLFQPYGTACLWLNIDVFIIDIITSSFISILLIRGEAQEKESNRMFTLFSFKNMWTGCLLIWYAFAIGL